MRKGFIKRVAGLAATAAFAFTMVFAVAAVDVQAEDKPITLTQGETTATYATVAEAVADRRRAGNDYADPGFYRGRRKGSGRTKYRI